LLPIVEAKGPKGQCTVQPAVPRTPAIGGLVCGDGKPRRCLLLEADFYPTVRPVLIQ
jgi:hypothetical protein